MLKAHLILAIAWIMFCFFHSFFASTWFKMGIIKISSFFIRLYRPLYSLFALFTFLGVLLYQVSIPTFFMYKLHYATIISGCIIALAGLVIMIICIYKYFSQISGLRALIFAHKGNKLMHEGIHRVVRHPLYSGTFLFLWGLFIAFPYLSLLVTNSIITIYTLIGIRFEEAKLEKEFGEEYRLYKRQVPMIFPFI